MVVYYFIQIIRYVFWFYDHFQVEIIDGRKTETIRS
jgi:uncharacterized protein YqfB (UPF0267 family)